MTSIEELEDELSRPSEADVEFLRQLEGDILILGAAGKMGPSLARLCRRAADAAGPARRILAVSRRLISEPGIDAISCDLLDRAQVAQLPDCPNVLYLAGRKFGSSDNPELTWAMNTVVPANVAERFRQSRIVVFSTGNVYALRAVAAGGSRETDAPAPVGEYAQSCLGRERVFEYFANHHGVRCLFFRLNYAVDLRYGVLVDIARKVYAGEPVDLAVPAFNAIWQRDANSYALRALAHCGTPPRILNITGLETVSGAGGGRVLRGALCAALPVSRRPRAGRALERCLGRGSADGAARGNHYPADGAGGRMGGRRRREFEQAHSFRGGRWEVLTRWTRRCYRRFSAAW